MFTLVAAIVGVAVTTALLIWGSLRLIREAEREQRDPKLLRRRFLRMGLFYVGCMLFGIVQVATGDLPPVALFGLLVPAAMAWLLIKQASSVKIDPR